MANYTINIINGTGSSPMQSGNYDVTVDANGYDNESLSPTIYTATDSAGTGTFTVEGAGTLTFIVNETGAEGGTAITTGTMVMTNQDGTQQYGSEVTITNGIAVFEKVPYIDDDMVNLYFKQLTSDSTHRPYSEVISVNMDSETKTQYVQNTPYATQTMTLTDSTYTGLGVSGTMTFTPIS